MFRRLLWHLLRGNRIRLAVALIALISGGAVISALINLEVSVRHELAQEFRSLGANLIISTPSADAGGGAPVLMDASIMQSLEPLQSRGVVASPLLYLVAHTDSTSDQNVVVAGTWLDRTPQMFPWWQITGSKSLSRTDTSHCLIGRNVSRSLGIVNGGEVDLHYESRTKKLTVAAVLDTGGPGDNQIFVNLPVAQALADADGKAQFVQLSVPGSFEDIRVLQSQLQSAFPMLAVKPIPQITAGEGKLLRRIQFLILSTGLLILVLTMLCILATMAALAMERRKDVGLMKALGGSMRKVVRIFLAEMGILALVGGLIGYALGVILSNWMAQRVFGVSITLQWEVLPITLALMALVTLGGALPLRLVGNVRPAVILRGE